MKQSTLLFLGGAAVLGFLYVNKKADTPAVVNTGTAAPVGNSTTPATGTSNAQTETGSEAAYAAAPSKVSTLRTRFDEMLESLGINKALT